MSEEQELGALLRDRVWRLNNLYWVEDEGGNKVKFRMNWAQQKFHDDIHWLNVILKARQLGMSTFMAIYILDTCLFGKNKTCGIIDKGDKDATKKLKKIKFAYDNLDCEDECEGTRTAILGGEIKKKVEIEYDNDHEIWWSNSSKVWAGSSLRGGTFQILHISELGYIAVNARKRAEEIRSGAFNTVHKGSMVVIESTHEGGKVGLNYEMIVAAQESPPELTEMDWKFHFYAWWQDPKYTVTENPRPVTDPKLVAYFAELQERKGIRLSDGQKAWYAAKERTQRDAMWKEFPSTAEEAVNAKIKGAIYGEEISRARSEGRVCEFNLEPGLPYYICWDIGMSDFTDLWLIQPVGVQHRVFRFYEENGMAVDHYAKVIKQWEQEYGPSTLNLLPHDAGRRVFGTAGGLTTVQTLDTMGIKNCVVVPRTPDIWVGINVLRGMMANMVFHKANLQEARKKDGKHYPSGLGALEAYRVDQENTQAVIREMPVHDEASHAADALRTYAEAFAAGMISSDGFRGSGARAGKPRVITSPGASRPGDDDDFDEARFSKIRVKGIY